MKKKKNAVLFTSSTLAFNGKSLRKEERTLLICTWNIFSLRYNWYRLSVLPQKAGRRSCVEASFLSGLVASQIKPRSLLYDGFTKLRDRIREPLM